MSATRVTASWCTGRDKDPGTCEGPTASAGLAIEESDRTFPGELGRFLVVRVRIDLTQERVSGGREDPREASSAIAPPRQNSVTPSLRVERGCEPEKSAARVHRRRCCVAKIALCSAVREVLMRNSIFALLSLLAVACGGSSEDGGSGGSTTGGKGGSGGVTGGSGGVTGGSGGVTGGSGGVTGGSGGVTGGSGGVAGGTGATGGGGLGGASNGGTGGGGTGGTSAAQPECKADSDCKVFSDCCTCMAVPIAENPTSCPLTCVIDSCVAAGAPKLPACVAGRCVMGFECDSSKVTCKSLPPKCGAGQVPQVSGDCWKGGCVAADECQSVHACSDCTGSLACASYQTQLGPQAHCVDIPKSCGGAATCACMGPSVCTDPFSSCNDLSGSQGVSCGCPTC
jgi:hypothetical protein